MSELEALDKRVEELELVARAAANKYWSFRSLCNEGRKYDRSKIGCRVIPRDGYFTITWFVNKTKNPKTFKPYSEYIRKGKDSPKYPMTALRKEARDWDYEMVQKTENLFATIREQLSIVTELRRKYKTLDRVKDKMDGFAEEMHVDIADLEDLDEMDD